MRINCSRLITASCQRHDSPAGFQLLHFQILENCANGNSGYQTVNIASHGWRSETHQHVFGLRRFISPMDRAFQLRSVIRDGKRITAFTAIPRTVAASS